MSFRNGQIVRVIISTFPWKKGDIIKLKQLSTYHTGYWEVDHPSHCIIHKYKILPLITKKPEDWL